MKTERSEIIHRVRKVCANEIFGSAIATTLRDPELRATSELLQECLGFQETDDGPFYPDIFPFMLAPGEDLTPKRIFRVEALMKASAVLFYYLKLLTTLRF